MYPFRRAAALSVSIIMLTSLFSGCSKRVDSGGPEVFYDSVSFDLADPQGKDSSYSYAPFLGLIDDLAVIYRYYYADNSSYIELYDMNGGLSASYDLSDVKELAGISDEAYMGDSICICNDDIVLEFTAYNSDGSSEVTFVFWNPLTGNISGSCECNCDIRISCRQYFPCGDKIVGLFEDYDDPSFLEVDVISADGDHLTSNVGQAYPESELGMFISSASISGTELLLVYSDMSAAGTGSDYSTFKVDTVTGEVSRKEDMVWDKIDPYELSFVRYVEGTGLILSLYDGIFKFDPDEQTLELLIDYDRCNVNIADIRQLVPFSFSEDKVIMGGNIYRENYFGTDVLTDLTVLTRSDTDPYAGRSPIRLAVTDSAVDYPLAEAIRIFNSENTDYYVYVDTSYSLDNFDGDLPFYDSSEYRYLIDAGQNALTNQLMIDLLAGEGPDLILSNGTYSQFYNDDILCDLSDLVPSEGYFDNVFDACRSDGKLYDMPLYFSISGIFTDADNVNAGQTGFDLDEYDEFVRTVCNGVNPVQREKIDFLLLCLGTADSEFRTSDGGVDYDCEAFRALAEYVNDNVTYRLPDEDDPDAWEDYYSLPMLDSTHAAIYEQFNNIWEFVGRFDPSRQIAMLGLPSYTANGPSVNINAAVSMSASTQYTDGCMEFISTLLSKPVQDIYSTQCGIPVNVASYEESAAITLEMYNRERDELLQMGIVDLRDLGMASRADGDDVIYRYEDYIRSCTSSFGSDPAVTIIIREEMPGYFEGQKTLDEVIEIIMDRVSTYINERG